MTRATQTLYALVISVGLPFTALSQTSPVCPGGHTLTLPVVLGLLRDNATDEAVPLNRIVGCHVNFMLDVSSLEQLSAAGASNAILEALNRNAEPPPTLSDATAMVGALEQHIAELDRINAAARDADLEKMDAVYKPQRDKAAQIQPQSQFESDAEYRIRKQKADAVVKQIDDVHQADRGRVIAEYEAKARKMDQLFRQQVNAYQRGSYPDPGELVYKTYNANAQRLIATIGGKEYWFDHLPGKVAETLFNNWKQVKVSRPYSDDEWQTRVLNLPELRAVSVPIAGYFRVALQSSKIAPLLSSAKTCEAQDDFNCASNNYQAVLSIQPDNEIAKAGEATARQRLNDGMKTRQHADVIEQQSETLYGQKNYKEALPLATEACLAGNQDGCGIEGSMYGLGLGVKRDLVRAKNLIETSCSSGSSKGCDFLGLAYFKGIGEPVDQQKAFNLFTISCDQSYPEGCANLAIFYLQGIVVKQDVSKAEQLLARACLRGVETACRENRKLGYVPLL